MSETFPNRDPELADESPSPRFPSRELERDELPSDELPKWRLSTFDIARVCETTDELDRDEFIATERPAPDALLEELEATAPLPAALREAAPAAVPAWVPADDPRAELVAEPPRAPPNPFQLPVDAPVPLEDIAVLAPPDLAAPAEFPNPCHWPSAIAGRAFERADALLKPPFDPRDAKRDPEEVPVPGRPYPPPYAERPFERPYGP
jgi:hypothetical protein